MFKELFSAFRHGDIMDQAFSEFAEMLDHAHWMFGRANDAVSRKVDPEEVRESIYQRDQSINSLLKGIRRKIVRHLTINPGMDVPAGLALMSVAKDAERIGDYCKNVYEVARFHTEGFHVSRYHDALEEIRKDVDGLFKTVREAWKSSQQHLAKDAIRMADSIRDRCDELIVQLLKERETMATHEAVAYSLLARHYKRVAGHLSNISTAVLGRIEELDFHP